MAEDRVVAAEAEEVERAVEVALRPRRLSEFVGQQVVREQLELVLHAAIARVLDGRARCHAHGGAELDRDDHREGRLAEPCLLYTSDAADE